MKPTQIGNNQPQIQIVVTIGTNMDELWAGAKRVKRNCTKTWYDYVEFSTKSLKTDVQIKLDRDKINKMGLSIPQIGNAIQLFLEVTTNLNLKTMEKIKRSILNTTNLKRKILMTSEILQYKLPKEA